MWLAGRRRSVRYHHEPQVNLKVLFVLINLICALLAVPGNQTGSKNCNDVTEKCVSDLRQKIEGYDSCLLSKDCYWSDAVCGVVHKKYACDVILDTCSLVMGQTTSNLFCGRREETKIRVTVATSTYSTPSSSVVPSTSSTIKHVLSSTQRPKIISSDGHEREPDKVIKPDSKGGVISSNSDQKPSASQPSVSKSKDIGLPDGQPIIVVGANMKNSSQKVPQGSKIVAGGDKSWSSDISGSGSRDSEPVSRKSRPPTTAKPGFSTTTAPTPLSTTSPSHSTTDPVTVGFSEDDQFQYPENTTEMEKDVILSEHGDLIVFSGEVIAIICLSAAIVVILCCLGCYYYCLSLMKRKIYTLPSNEYPKPEKRSFTRLFWRNTRVTKQQKRLLQDMESCANYLSHRSNANFVKNVNPDLVKRIQDALGDQSEPRGHSQAAHVLNNPFLRQASFRGRSRGRGSFPIVRGRGSRLSGVSVGSFEDIPLRSSQEDDNRSFASALDHFGDALV